MEKNKIEEAEINSSKSTTKKKKKKEIEKKRVLIPIIIATVTILVGLLIGLHSNYYQSTDDAFVEGRLISVAPRVSGQVINLLVDDNEFVEEGQLLVEIDPKDYQNKVNELEGALKEAQSNKDISSSDIIKTEADLSSVNKNYEFAKKDFERYSKLKQNGLCTKQQYDSAQTAYKQAIEKQNSMKASLKSSISKASATNANIDKIKAQLEQAKLELSYTKVYAPQAGMISARNVEKGNYLQTGQPIVQIVPKKVWIVANFKENQLTNMKPNQKVSIKVDTYPNKRFKGHIDSIQRATGAKSSLFPPENAVGSYVKIVQRIPVKIVFDEDIDNYNIVPGMSVVPKVKVK